MNCEPRERGQRLVFAWPEFELYCAWSLRDPHPHGLGSNLLLPRGCLWCLVPPPRPPPSLLASPRPDSCRRVGCVGEWVSGQADLDECGVARGG